MALREPKLNSTTSGRSLKRAGLCEEVKDRLHESGTGLSGGQQQRLCIARAIAVNPEIILMDEPCSALDPIATAKIEELIDELRKNYTIVIVTHSMQQAARVSQRAAFFHLANSSRKVRPRMMFTSPNDKRTARYITGRLRSRPGRWLDHHTAKAFDVDLEELAPHGGRDGRAGRGNADSVGERWPSATPSGAESDRRRCGDRRAGAGN